MKLLLKILAGFVGLIVLIVAGLAIYIFATAINPSRPVGFQRVVAADPGHPPISVAVWYPTDARPGFIMLGSSGERVASDGPVAGTELPLVVISHGTGGGAMSHADTAIALAEAGFVVAAPTHTGDNFQDASAVGASRWLVDRSRHIARVNDFMLTKWKDHARLDAGRVGVFGFSAGATAALISIGGVPDLGRLASQCAQHPEFVCQLRKPGPFAAPPPAAFTHDPRIKAAVIAAPGLGFTFEPAGLSNVTAPVQLWSGGADQTVPYATNAGAVRGLLPTPAQSNIVPKAVHLSFLAPCGLIGPPQICKDGPGFDRKDFHKTFNHSVVAFFEANLPAQGAAAPEAR